MSEVIHSFSCSPIKIFLCSISSHHNKIALHFSNGYIRVCDLPNFTKSITKNKDITAISSLPIPEHSNIEDIAWSLENEESEYLAVLYGNGIVGLYVYKEGYDLALFNTVHSTKTIDAFCWNKGSLSFICCYQDGSLSHYKLNTTSIQCLYTLNLPIILNELSLRLHYPYCF